MELSTRKIGLKIDSDDDVIDEIYNSWYEFLAVTRELVKDIPVVKVHQDSTRKIIQLSIEVLNTALRLHLTKWQARFRRWHANQLERDKDALEHPQDIQKRFPDYDKLVAEMPYLPRKRYVRFRNSPGRPERRKWGAKWPESSFANFRS